MLGTLLDAGNTKMKIKTKQNKNKTTSLLIPPTPDLRQIWLEPGKLAPQGFSPKPWGIACSPPPLTSTLPPKTEQPVPFSKPCIFHLPEQLSPAGRISFWMKNPKLGEQFWPRRESRKGTCSVSLGEVHGDRELGGACCRGKGEGGQLEMLLPLRLEQNLPQCGVVGDRGVSL